MQLHVHQGTVQGHGQQLPGATGQQGTIVGDFPKGQSMQELLVDFVYAQAPEPTNASVPALSE